MTGTVAAARPGRQRSPAADAAILDATLELLRDRGYDGLTMAAVIEKAGVSSATLYRRWTAKSDLVAAAIASLTPEEAEIDTGSLEGDLAAFLRHLTRTLAARGGIASLIVRGSPMRDEELHGALRAKLVTPRVRTLDGILRRAAERGEVTSPPSAETCLALLVGPLHYRAVVANESITPAFARDILRVALDGLRG